MLNFRLYIFILTAFIAVIGSSVTSRPQAFAESRAAIPAPQQISYVLSASDCAIPVQIDYQPVSKTYFLQGEAAQQAVRVFKL